MFDDFDMEVSCEEYYEDGFEDWHDDCDSWESEVGFDPYMGCYSWDC